MLSGVYSDGSFVHRPNSGDFRPCFPKPKAFKTLQLFQFSKFILSYQVSFSYSIVRGPLGCANWVSSWELRIDWFAKDGGSLLDKMLFMLRVSSCSPCYTDALSFYSSALIPKKRHDPTLSILTFHQGIGDGGSIPTKMKPMPPRNKGPFGERGARFLEKDSSWRRRHWIEVSQCEKWDEASEWSNFTRSIVIGLHPAKSWPGAWCR